MFIKSKKGEAEFYWKLLLLILALAFLIFGFLFLSKTGNTIITGIKSFFGMFT